jgi:folylpolyglutamate synthase/dihydropteroate synthase
MDPINLATIDSYQQAVDWLEEHYNLESVLGKPETVPPSLDRMRVVMELLGHPEIAVPAIHITGTNGKGSTTRMIVEIIHNKIHFASLVVTHKDVDLGD